jgi:hypothetical protein
MIVHMTTVHPRTDTRIRVKETPSLAQASGTVVTLFVQDGKGDEQDVVRRVSVVDTGVPQKSRLLRMTKGSWKMYRAVKAARPEIAHFHDPELIPVGLLLKVAGIKVIYDVHEDVPRQILGKPWLPAWLRRPVSWLIEFAERVATKVFDGFVVATPTIAARFPDQRTITVENFPIIDELVVTSAIPYPERPPRFGYVGDISLARGARNMVLALEKLGGSDHALELAGAYQPPSFQDELESLAGWSRVNFHGWVERGKVANLLGSVRAGLVVLHPTINYLDSLPVKMFEYMATSLPVIASDFPLWRSIIDEARCGLLVDPLDPPAIAAAMRWILDHPGEAQAMGESGRRAVERQFNWNSASRKLTAFYERLLE